jgi:hypothetical protein
MTLAEFLDDAVRILPYCPEDIYQMTPAEITLKIEGQIEYYKHMHEIMLHAGYMNAALERTKRLPRWEKFMAGHKDKPDAKKMKEWYLKEMETVNG